MVTKTKHQAKPVKTADSSGLDTAVIYRRLRQQLPEDALLMPLQLSLSPLPVRREQSGQHGEYIATTLAALTGPCGCLPPSYEETALAQVQARNLSYADFIALFQRHLADLFIEASAKYSAHKQNRWLHKEENPFINVILALAGCRRDQHPDMQRDFCIRFATLFADNRRNAASLEAMLKNLFNVPVKIAELYPKWQKINDDELSFLNGLCRLGIDSCLGAATRNAAGHFRIILGTLLYEKFRNFLPDQPATGYLIALTRYYCGTGLTFDIQLVLDKDEVPAASLSGNYRLGYDLWLENSQPHDHRNDAIFDGQMISTPALQDINDVS